MKIDLTQPFTTQDVADLLASEDDTHNTQLRVTRTGEAYLSRVVGNHDIAELAFRLETWLAGNDYTGANAAADSKFVRKIEKVLRDNWPNPSSAYIDFFQ